MTIASEITRIQNGVASAYSSVSTKGGTLPATQNLNNLPSAIESIPSGGGSIFNLSLDNTIGKIDNTDSLVIEPINNITFNGVKHLTYEVLKQRFTYRTDITGEISFPDLIDIKKFGACNSTFYRCSNISSVSFGSLTEISANSACYEMFNYCTSISSVSFPLLAYISGSSACYYMFGNCTALANVQFQSLSSLRTSAPFVGCFGGCYNLTNIYFNSLTTSSFGSYTNQFSSMFNSSTAQTSGTCTVHFPSNLSATIAGLTGYPTFGGNASRIVLSFDLPETS